MLKLLAFRAAPQSLGRIVIVLRGWFTNAAYKQYHMTQIGHISPADNTDALGGWAEAAEDKYGIVTWFGARAL